MNKLTVTLACEDLVEALEFQNKIVKMANKSGVLVKHLDLEIASEATQTGRGSGADRVNDVGNTRKGGE